MAGEFDQFFIDESPTAGAIPAGFFIDEPEAAQPESAVRMHPNTLRGWLGAAGDMLSEAPGNIWEGVKKAPQAAYDIVTSVPQGVENVGNLVWNDLPGALQDATSIAKNELFGTPIQPSQLVDYKRAENTLRGVGNLGTTAAAIGVAPGASAPLSGAAGMTLFDKILQYVGVDSVSDPNQDLKKLEENIGTFAALQGAGKVAETGIKTTAKGLKAAAPVLKKASEQLDRNSLQTLRSDFGKNSDLRTIETPEGGVQTYARAAIDDLLRNKELGKSRNPETLTKIVNKNMEKYAKEAGSLITRYDKSGKPSVVPEFPNALKYLEEGEVPADLVESYLNRLVQIESGIVREGQGKLAYMQQQKIALGRAWDPADITKSNFDRAIYTDLKNQIEKYVPEIKPINAELGKWEVVQPIVNRSLKAAENSSFLKDLKNLSFTTGGIAGAGVLGNALGGPGGAALGTISAGTLRYLASPTGQAQISRALSKLGSASEAASARVSSLGDALFQVKKPPISAGLSTLNEPEQTPSSTALDKPQKRSEITTVQNKIPTDSLFTPTSYNSRLFAVDEQPLFNVPGNSDLSQGVENMYKGKPLKEVLAAVKSDPVDEAIMMVESGGNAEVKNPNSSATGLFQLISSTAKNLGVENVKDPGENYDGYLKLKAENQAALKLLGEGYDQDPGMIYAAHFLGAPTLVKYLSGKPLSAKEEKHVKDLKREALPRFQRWYGKIIKEKSGVTEA